MSDTKSLPDLIGWFDMPVTDLERAVDFYQSVVGRSVAIENYGDMQFGLFAHKDGNAGCLVPSKEPITSDNAVLLYMNVDGRIRDAVGQTKGHGGSVLQDVHPIGPYGFRAIIRDSEGNRIALHSTVDQ